MMDEELRGLLVGRIQDVCDARAKEGSFAINDAAKQVIDEMRAEDNKRWKELRDYFAEQGVIHMVNRVITQAQGSRPQATTPPQPRIHAAPHHLRRRGNPGGTT